MKFWKDKWCGDMPLRDFFPNLYSIGSSKDAWVSNVWDGSNWDPRFIRQLHDWDMEEVDVFLGMLYDHSIYVGIDDVMVWMETRNGNF